MDIQGLESRPYGGSEAHKNGNGECTLSVEWSLTVSFQWLAAVTDTFAESMMTSVPA